MGITDFVMAGFNVHWTGILIFFCSFLDMYNVEMTVNTICFWKEK